MLFVSQLQRNDERSHNRLYIHFLTTTTLQKTGLVNGDPEKRQTIH